MSDGFSSEKGILQPRFEVYEMLEQADVMFFGGGQYETLSSIVAQLIRSRGSIVTLKDAIISGLKVIPQSAMSIQLEAGLTISFQGQYVVNEATEAMDFTADTDRAFIALLGSTENLTIQAAHGTNDRMDLIQIRPQLLAYDSATRTFKDPVTGITNGQVIDTKREVRMQVQVVQGAEDGSDVAPTVTAGWIKIAEVNVDALVTVINTDDILNVDAIISGDSNTGWTTEADNTFLSIGDKARSVNIEDAGGRIAATEVESAIQEIAGSGRTTETLKSALQDVFTTKGDILVRGSSIEERITAGLLDYYLKGQGAGEKPIFEKLALRDTGIFVGNGEANSDEDTVFNTVGYRPSIVIILGVAINYQNVCYSVGFDNFDGDARGCISLGYGGTEVSCLLTTACRIDYSLGNRILGQVSAQDNNGFTITWNETGTAGVYFLVLALP